MPTRPPADDSEPWPFAADVLRRLDDVERRIIRVPEGEDTILQVYEDGEPLGDVRHLDFGPGVLAEKLNADWARVTGQAAGGGGSWATVTVAAVDSHQKAKDEADFVCTGVNDEVMLLAALTELKLRCTLPSTAVTYGKMGLYQGTYYLKDTFSNYVGGPNNVPIWLQGLGVGTEIRADTGFLGTHLISLGTTNIGRTYISDLQLNCANLAQNGLAMGGPFSPNPSTHRQFVWNLLVQNFSAYGIFGQGGVGPATFIDNVETVGGVVGIYADGVNPGRVINCRVKNASGYGILTRSRTIDCIAENNDIGIYINNSGTGSPDGNGPYTSVIGNWVSGGDVGIQLDGYEITCVGNTILATGEEGIKSSTGRLIIANNIIRDCGTDGNFDGIKLTPHSDPNDGGGQTSVLDNYIRNTTKNGVSVSSLSATNRVEHIRVSGNIIVKPNQHGIHFDGINAGVINGEIQDNYIDNASVQTHNTYDGIHLSGNTDQIDIQGNTVRRGTNNLGVNRTRYAINIADSTCNDNLVCNNDLFDGGTTGKFNDAGTGTRKCPDGELAGSASGGGTAPANADYLVGTATADLSAEIVVGTTPGGELGGTWASPTVDATHSGSAHTDFIAKALVDAKGDIITATADDTPVRKAVGADGTALVASAAEGDGLVWGTPAVLNFAAATTLGTVVGKVEIFDGAGVSLGFLPVYDAIT